MSRPMTGIRILEVAEHAFVPTAGAVLSDWGADIIKVEHAQRGDAMRGLAQTGVMKLGDGVHVLNEHANRGKRSIGIDIANPEGRKIIFELAKTADVFLTNKLPVKLAKLGIDVADLRAQNPDIIYVRGTAYGPRGPEAERGGYDMTSFWCRGGTAAALTHPKYGVAPQAGPAYGDSLGGMTIAGGIAAALFQRERTGETAVIDVSLLNMGMWAMSSAIALSLQTGAPWTSFSMQSGGGNPLTGTYKTKDDRHVFVVRSTVLPGTVNDVIRPLIEEHSGKQLGDGFGLCFQPEFLREGSSIKDICQEGWGCLLWGKSPRGMQVSRMQQRGRTFFVICLIVGFLLSLILFGSRLWP